MPTTSMPKDTAIPSVRVAVETLCPDASRALTALDKVVRKTAIDPGLLDLIRLRVSQINGCAYCVDTHSRDALAAGQTERRVFAIPVWRDTPFFTPRERAALELAEAMTRLADNPVTDEIVARSADYFPPSKLSELMWVITVINAWNRLGATARPWPLI